jgi:hypothetical protein
MLQRLLLDGRFTEMFLDFIMCNTERVGYVHSFTFTV